MANPSGKTLETKTSEKARNIEKNLGSTISKQDASIQELQPQFALTVLQLNKATQFKTEV